MIVSKPKASTLLSISLFLFIAYGVGIWSIWLIPDTSFWWYLIPVIFVLIAIAITLKVVVGYRRLVLDRESWKVKKLIGKDFEFTTKDIIQWKVTEIKTGGGLFKELQIDTAKGVVKVSLQEHTEYIKIYHKVKTRCPKKQANE